MITSAYSSNRIVKTISKREATDFPLPGGFVLRPTETPAVVEARNAHSGLSTVEQRVGKGMHGRLLDAFPA